MVRNHVESMTLEVITGKLLFWRRVYFSLRRQRHHCMRIYGNRKQWIQTGHARCGRPFHNTCVRRVTASSLYGRRRKVTCAVDHARRRICCTTRPDLTRTPIKRNRVPASFIFSILCSPSANKHLRQVRGERSVVGIVHGRRSTMGEVTSQQSMVTIRSPCSKAWCRAVRS